MKVTLTKSSCKGLSLFYSMAGYYCLFAAVLATMDGNYYFTVLDILISLYHLRIYKRMHTARVLFTIYPKATIVVTDEDTSIR